MSLVVKYQEIVAADLTTPIKPAAWRVAVRGDELHDMALPLEFARETDAKRAQIALEDAGLVDVDALLDVGEEYFCRIMVESLAW